MQPTHLRKLVVVAALAAASFIPLDSADAQWRRHSRDRSVSIMAGAFYHDYYGDEAAPMAALRFNWEVRRWLVTEFGTFYARPETDNDDDVSMTGADVSIQAQLPHPLLQPYLGLGTGIHITLEQEPGDRYAESSTQAMGGLRLSLGRGIGLRGEIRYRIDDQQSSTNAADNIELTAGLSWAW